MSRLSTSKDLKPRWRWPTSPFGLKSYQGPVSYTGVPERAYGCTHGFVWAVEQLRLGRRVTRSVGLRGGRHFFKSIHQAYELVSEREILAEDWGLWRKPQHMSIPRHKTAISRRHLSRPARLALFKKLYTPEDTYLDFGCGKGGDVTHLQSLGFQAKGWDPHWCPETPLEQADVVACIYVLNVIEDQVERRKTLLQAWRLAKRVFIVAARTDSPRNPGTPYADGILTKAGTFQRFYTHKKLLAYLEEVCGCSFQALGSGVFFHRKESSKTAKEAPNERPPFASATK